MFRLALFMTFLPFLAACTTSPVTGQPIFTGVVSEQEEENIGRQQHAQILKQFGLNDNAKLNEFVAGIGVRLAPQAERKNVRWTFTVLDDDTVNAFAVPGGYIYITRGLLAVAQDESQVAAVLAHEMGHINARHSAQQMSQGLLANIGLQAVGIATGSNVATQAGGIGADLYLKKYSRSHEFEADALGVKYLTGAGYDPYAEEKFLAMLAQSTRLEARMAGQENTPQNALLSTHPLTPDRIVRAGALADQTMKIQNATINRAGYLRAIDGTVYGDAASQGFIRGQEFIHPVLKIRFAAPGGFTLQNSPKQVVAETGSGAAMVFDTARADTSDPVQFITGSWAPGANLSQQESITVNGMAAATASTMMQTNQMRKIERLVAFHGGV